MATKGATQPGVLTAKQLRFVDEYLVDSNATQAAIRAGYSAKAASVAGCKLVSNGKVAAAIATKQKQLSHEMGVTHEKVISAISKIAFQPIPDGDAKANDVLKGLEMLAKHLGLGAGDKPTAMSVPTNTTALSEKIAAILAL